MDEPYTIPIHPPIAYRLCVESPFAFVGSVYPMRYRLVWGCGWGCAGRLAEAGYIGVGGAQREAPRGCLGANGLWGCLLGGVVIPLRYVGAIVRVGWVGGLVVWQRERVAMIVAGKYLIGK